MQSAARAMNDSPTAARTGGRPRSRSGKPWQWVERWSQRWWHRYLARLVQHRGNVSESFGDVPKRMHAVANQTRLVLELIDDFKSGTYRDISWHAIVILTAAVLYAVSPADVVPDFLPLVGALDDLTVVAVATRFARRELEDYCAFKNYPADDYFGHGA